MGSYCSYLLPKQNDGTSQIEVNPTKSQTTSHPVVSDHHGHPVRICLSLLELIWNTHPVQELDNELGGVDGYFTMFGMHYVGMFANPRMRVLFDTRKGILTTMWTISIQIGLRKKYVQPADIGWPTGNGKKLSCSQAQLGQATCLAVA